MSRPSPQRAGASASPGGSRTFEWAFALVLSVLALALLLGAAPAARAQTVEAGRTPVPAVEPARGGHCVADPAYMRLHHMDLLRHQRDDTVHRGNRAAPYSLKACIQCHASLKTNSVVASPENFCQSCHRYAAVKIDCFECHASQPAGTTTASAKQP